MCSFPFHAIVQTRNLRIINNFALIPSTDLSFLSEKKPTKCTIYSILWFLESFALKSLCCMTAGDKQGPYVQGHQQPSQLHLKN